MANAQHGTLMVLEAKGVILPSSILSSAMTSLLYQKHGVQMMMIMQICLTLYVSLHHLLYNMAQNYQNMGEHLVEY